MVILIILVVGILCFAAEKAKRKVLAGPSEATAIGNLMAQMIENQVFTDLKAARRCVYESFEIKEFK